MSATGFNLRRRQEAAKKEAEEKAVAIEEEKPKRGRPAKKEDVSDEESV